jgi:hypothetical protein
MRNLINKAKALSKTAAVAAVLGASSFAGIASAQTSAGSYGDILSGLDTSTAITAVIAAGTLLAGLGFAKWATKKVARFFG